MNVDETNMILNKNARNIRRLKIRFEVNLSNAIDQIKKKRSTIYCDRDTWMESFLDSIL